MEEEHNLILYYKPTCPFCQKVLDYLESIEEEIPLKNIDEDPKAREELLHLGGKTQVPCLFIDDKPLYESDDIIDWIKEKRETFE
ncbi:MAG: glutaredoxin [Chlamydiia bacterium]|nr:glutaredoxin [Chlamydiia bacterium]